MKKLCAMVITSLSVFMTFAAEYESTTYTTPTTKYEKTYKTKYESKYNGNGSRTRRRPVRMQKEQTTTTEERYPSRPSRKKFKETYQEEQQYQQPQQYRSESRYQSESSY